MTTAVGSAITGELSRLMSIGYENMEVQTLAIISGDTVGTVTAKTLNRVDHAIVCVGSLTLTAAPTYSANVVTLAFTDPAANRFGSIILLGK